MELTHLQQSDSKLYEILKKEQKRQEENIEIIASENIVSQSVLEAQGSILTNKYAEGYPKKRYYGGCEFIDEVEQLAIERVCKLFGSNFANVQPHSGSQANQAVYLSVLKPGDKILGMNLSEGGHLTHGSPVNVSGKLFNTEFYGLDHNTGRIDYDKLRESANSFRPKMIIAGASAYSRIIDFDKFKEIANECGALLFVDMAHIAGLIAAGLHPSPIDVADFVSSTTHKTLRGPRGGIVLTSSSENAKKINSLVFPGLQGGPLEHVIAAKATAFKEALKPSFVDYQKRVLENAKCLASELINKDFDIISGGTDNHLMLVSLINKGITGKQLETGLDQSGITANKNSIPNDPKSPFITSGMRIGTPAVTTRGMGKDEMKIIANWINQVSVALEKNEQLEATYIRIKNEVREMVKKFSIYF